MAKSSSQPPSKSPSQPPARPSSAAEQRAARLAKALRDNLKRRKAQARGRAAQDGPATGRDEDA